MDKLYYHKLDEAEELRRSYASWIGKRAHVGNGRTAILLAISIKQKRNLNASKQAEELYRIQFEFDTSHKLSSFEFLFYNGFVSSNEIGNFIKRDQNSAA
jgi:hypothetical protein